MGKFISGGGKKDRSVGYGGDDQEDSPSNGAAVSFPHTRRESEGHGIAVRSLSGGSQEVATTVFYSLARLEPIMI